MEINEVLKNTRVNLCIPPCSAVVSVMRKFINQE